MPSEEEGQQESFPQLREGEYFITDVPYNRGHMMFFFKKQTSLGVQSVLVFFFTSLQTVAPLLPTLRADHSHWPLLVLLSELDPASIGQDPPPGEWIVRKRKTFPPPPLQRGFTWSTGLLITGVLAHSKAH